MTTPANNFLSLDLTKSWQASTPALNNLPQPSGPPAVANGYLWNSLQSLFLYGGEFSDYPPTPPSPPTLWEYSIGSSSWQQFSNPQTSAGTNAPDGNLPVQQVAEGAGVAVPGIGRGFFFGGHQDPFTTASWPQNVPRIYLNTLLEYAYPASDSPGGAWQNVTGSDSPPTADGVLVYIPGFGDDGILVALAGGTADTYAQLNTVQIFDIATSSWYQQSTSGKTPQSRVNPCAVAAAAADGSSYNIYLYGGQNLQPAGAQQQYSDMWILTVPAFTWIQVNTASQGGPAARAGHTCNVWDGQMIVSGGYLGDSGSCDAPGATFVFNLSSLAWAPQFSRVSDARQNPLSLQDSQAANASGPNAALQGSFGYAVPAPVQSAVGGHALGGATITQPVAAATAGPLASGGPRVYTVTASGPGATSTSTVSGKDGGGNSATIVGAVVGSVAGVLFLLLLYAGYCAWLYRKRLRLYQEHMEAEREQREKDGVANTLNGASAHLAARGSRRSHRGLSTRSSTDDLLGSMEPTFFGIMLHPKRSLRVVNR